MSDSSDSKKDSYTGKDITVLSGTEGIRKRPAMYIGSTDSRGMLHLLFEIIDNSIDEALAGYCKNITIRLEREDNMDVAEVEDDGRGIPVDIVEKYNKPALEVILTHIHAGAKFSNNVYKVSGGLHGVGLTVVNALSEYLIVTVMRDGKIYRQRYSRGASVSQLEIIGSIDGNKTGTIIRFKPDREIFSSDSFDSMLLEERVRYLAFLNPGITIRLIDSRYESKRELIFRYENGLRDFLDDINSKKPLITDQIVIDKTEQNVRVNIAFDYVDDYSEKVLGFANSIRTYDGGTHITGFYSGLSKAIQSYIDSNEKIKKSLKVKIEAEDMHEGLRAVVAVYLPNPEFEGQTKEKLGNSIVKSIVEKIVYDELYSYLDKNPGKASALINKLAIAATARESARKAREIVRKSKEIDKILLAGKLADCSEDDSSITELFIVEGRSAAGSSKQARDRRIQAILPLRGKVLNVEKANLEKVFNNEELKSIVAALGTNMKEKFDYSKLRYNKIIILTDADVDGSHIRTLLLTFFYRYMPQLIEKGHLYVAQPPLYRVQHGTEVIYAYSDSELEELKKRYGKVIVQRFKGLGEMNPEQLWETAMNPKTRRLKQITVRDAEEANRIFDILMGADVEKRKEFIEQHATEAVLDI
ncbi:MAG: DNA gyrase subunit B [Candidatus Micrarchaeota archaeon]|nr:MAG: DNA gyrase subunit B [Candidatus Micrarchaeota archaeon]